MSINNENVAEPNVIVMSALSTTAGVAPPLAHMGLILDHWPRNIVAARLDSSS